MGHIWAQLHKLNENKRGRCIFHTSCSVEQARKTGEGGRMAGSGVMAQLHLPFC